MIFIIPKEHDTISQRIWLQKEDSVSEKSKSTHYKNLAQKILVFESKFQSLIMKNNRKAAIYFRTSIKNQIAWLEKGFKKAWENLGIIGSDLSNENVIGLEDEV